MNVLIMTEGGKTKGFGHIARCIALYQAFEEKGISPEMFINCDETANDLLRGTKYKNVNWLADDTEVLNIASNKDIVIIDSYTADEDFYEKISKLTRTPVYLDDNKRINYPRGLVVNGGICAEEIDYPQKEGIAYLLGPKYIPIRRTFWQVQDKAIKTEIKNVMITFGGDDSANLTPGILHVLNENYPELIKNVVIGKGFKNIDQIERAKTENTVLIYFPDAEDIKKTMFESDLALSAAGQTLYELARIGVPTIAVAVADNQLNNVNGWGKTGFISYAGWWEDNLLYKNIGIQINEFNDVCKRINSMKTGRDLVNGKGARAIVEFIMMRED